MEQLRALAADCSRVMGADRRARMERTEANASSAEAQELLVCLNDLQDDAARVWRCAVARYARQRRPGIISLGGMSSLGTVQRCQNPVVLPSLHGGLPPAQTIDRYVHREYN